MYQWHKGNIGKTLLHITAHSGLIPLILMSSPVHGKVIRVHFILSLYVIAIY